MRGASLIRASALVLQLTCAAPATAVNTIEWARGVPRSATVPAQVTQHVLLAHFSVHGTQLLFLIDTGAAESVLDTRAAARLNLTPSAAQTLATSGAAVRAGQIKGLDVSGPHFSVTDVPFAVTSLSEMATHFGQRVDGILGYDFLEWLTVDFDYATRRLQLGEARPDTTAGRSCVPLKFIDRLPYVSVSVIGKKGTERIGTFLVDTGASGTLLMAGMFGTDPALLAGADVRHSAGHGVGGAFTSTLIPVAALRLGSFELKEPQVAARDDARADHADGLLGGALLERFSVRLVYAIKRMCLTPGPHFAQVFANDLAGFIPVWPEPDLKPLTVEFVSPDSPAAHAGLRAGDVVEAIGARPAAALGVDELALLMRASGAVYDLRISRAGRPVSLHLELPGTGRP